MRRRTILLVVCVALIAALWALSWWPWFVERVYARGISFQVSRALSILTSVVPISLAALLIPGAGLYLFVPFVITSARVLRGHRRWLDAVRGGALRVATFVAVIGAVFYLAWGLNYARAPLQARLGWPAIDRAADDAEALRQTEEIATLAAEAVTLANEHYRALAGSDDLGRPSGPADPARDLESALDAGFARAQQALDLEPALAISRGRAKGFPFSRMLSHLQLTGFYFPWSGEANYNADAPASSTPLTIAHEKAHQRGIAREDEANFIGYLACAMSDHAYARYSAAVFAQNQLIGELGRRDPERAGVVARERGPGVRRDLAFVRAYWQQFEGVAARVSHAVNDRYLKSQGVPSGVLSYAASRNLLVLFARQRGGVLRIAPADGRR